MSLSAVFSGREQRLQLTLVAYAAGRACLFTRCERMGPTDVRAPRSLWRWLALAAVAGSGVFGALAWRDVTIEQATPATALRRFDEARANGHRVLAWTERDTRRLPERGD